jgi:hypothetical protein
MSWSDERGRRGDFGRERQGVGTMTAMGLPQLVRLREFIVSPGVVGAAVMFGVLPAARQYAPQLQRW